MKIMPLWLKFGWVSDRSSVAIITFAMAEMEPNIAQIKAEAVRVDNLMRIHQVPPPNGAIQK
mgnify:CR=1 FL=1